MLPDIFYILYYWDGTIHKGVQKLYVDKVPVAFYDCKQTEYHNKA